MKKLYLILIMILSFALLISCNNVNEDEKKIDYDGHKYFIYELASQSGYDGSYDDWLKSIKGDNHHPVEITMIDTVLCWRYVGDEYFTPLYDLTSSLSNKDNKIKPNEPDIQEENCNTTESTYQIYLKHFPDYNKTEEEWLDDLLNGRLSNNPDNQTPINNNDDVTEPESIVITGENEMYVGYATQLIYSVLPLDAPQTVNWQSSDDSVATVNENGVVTALSSGTVRIKATSTLNNNVCGVFKIEIRLGIVDYIIPNMGGYTIIIMNADSALSDNDPFLEHYRGSDKLFKQRAWNEVKEEYNCDIKVVPYPAEATWGDPRINWIKDHAATNTSECDLAIVSSNWICDIAKSLSAVDVTEYYRNYGKKQMDPAMKEAGSYHNKLYAASTGITTTSNNVDIGLYYNYGLLKRLGLDDPATLFNEGKWNYTGFEKWVREAQSKMGDGKFALGGHPYYYYYGMTNAAGVKIIDTTLSSVNIMSKESKNAMNLMAKLTQEGCVYNVATWAESPSATGCDFYDESILMTTGCLYFFSSTSRWTRSQLQWEETPEFGYVPFPYPDDVKKEDTRIGASGYSVYMYIAGRNYPAGVDAECVYRAMNDMFLRTHKYQESDETFNASEIIYNSLKKTIDNDASIEAMMYYDSSRTFYDPAHAIYGSTGGSRLREPTIDVMFGGQDFDEVFERVRVLYEQDVANALG